MRLLLVDDTKIHLTLFKVYLQARDVEFMTAESGKGALALARSRKPDLIISDVKMAEMDGFELCAAVREDPALASTPVVLVTSLSDAASRKKGQLVGATGFLTKPVQPAAVRQIVEEVLGVKL